MSCKANKLLGVLIENNNNNKYYSSNNKLNVCINVIYGHLLVHEQL
jgi:hypothetical protein